MLTSLKDAIPRAISIRASATSRGFGLAARNSSSMHYHVEIRGEQLRSILNKERRYRPPFEVAFGNRLLDFPARVRRASHFAFQESRAGIKTRSGVAAVTARREYGRSLRFDIECAPCLQAVSNWRAKSSARRKLRARPKKRLVLREKCFATPSGCIRIYLK